MIILAALLKLITNFTKIKLGNKILTSYVVQFRSINTKKLPVFL